MRSRPPGHPTKQPSGPSPAVSGKIEPTDKSVYVRRYCAQSMIPERDFALSATYTLTNKLVTSDVLEAGHGVIGGLSIVRRMPGLRSDHPLVVTMNGRTAAATATSVRKLAETTTGSPSLMMPWLISTSSSSRRPSFTSRGSKRPCHLSTRTVFLLPVTRTALSGIAGAGSRACVSAAARTGT